VGHLGKEAGGEVVFGPLFFMSEGVSSGFRS
jgi:hypothetical protein